MSETLPPNQREPDPRVYFAAERTLLAWIRTALSVIAIGFLVARFGLFVRLVRNDGESAGSIAFASAIGLAMVLLGTIMLAITAWQHRRFCQSLRPHELPGKYSIRFALGISGMLTILGAFLGVYLWWSS